MSPDRPARRWDRKRIRLDDQAYSQLSAVCSITIAIQRRRPLFADPVLASGMVEVLLRHASQTGVRIYAYCVMPDHVHLVLGPSRTTDIVTFVGQFKNLAQRTAWQHGLQGVLWQKSFWDHFLRREEDVERVVDYVLNNPVRQGLVDQWSDYPFSGSLVFKL